MILVVKHERLCLKREVRGVVRELVGMQDGLHGLHVIGSDFRVFILLNFNNSGRRCCMQCPNTAMCRVDNVHAQSVGFVVKNKML